MGADAHGGEIDMDTAKYAQLIDEHNAAKAAAKKFGMAMVNSRFVDGETITKWIQLVEKAAVLNLRLIELEAAAETRRLFERIEALKADATQSDEWRGSK
jgi:hypothetical protein